MRAADTDHGRSRTASNPKVEPKARAMSPAASSQLGVSLGNHAMHSDGRVLKGAGVPLEAGKGYSTPVGPAPMSAAGPGAGRTVYKSGGQGTHGPAAGEKPEQARQIIERQGGPRVTR
jgi:hypothetical protein